MLFVPETPFQPLHGWGSAVKNIPASYVGMKIMKLISYLPKIEL